MHGAFSLQPVKICLSTLLCVTGSQASILFLCGFRQGHGPLGESQVAAEAAVWPRHRPHISRVFSSVPALNRMFPDSVPSGSPVLPLCTARTLPVQVGSQPREEGSVPPVPETQRSRRNSAAT